MTEPTVIRASSLSTYPDCPRRAAARLFWREVTAAGYTLRRTGRGIPPIIGSAVHHAVSVELAEKAQTGELPPVSVALDAGRDYLADEVKVGEVIYDGPHGTAHNMRDAAAQVVMMTRAYHAEVAPRVQPIAIEERLEAEVEPGIVLSGQPDLVAREPGAIRDTKTGARSPATFAPQLGAYSLLARSNGIDIDHAAIDFIQRVSPKKPQPPPVTKYAAIEDAETAATNILRHIAFDLKTFREGDPERRILPGDSWAFLANPSSILCSPRYCAAFGTAFCREGDPSKLTKGSVSHDTND